MATQWLRLWHDMPNDPKWRTIARVSKQPITAVLSVYLHILVIASNATERGRTQSVCSEDIASALDLDCEQVDEIISAMQGRVLDGDVVSGWSKRQVEREDGSAERAKAWREAKKEEHKDKTNADERRRTQDERKETPDKDTDTDTDTEKKKTTSSTKPKFDALGYLVGLGVVSEVADEWLAIRAGKKLFNTKVGLDAALGDGKERGLKPNDAITAMWKKGHPCFYEDLRSVPRSKAAAKLWADEPRDWL